MRPVWLALAFVPLCAWAGKDDVPVAVHCDEEVAECREDCAMAFGTSMSTRPQWRKCINKCLKRDGVCRERHFESHRAGLAPGALEEKKRARAETAPKPQKPSPAPAPAPEDEGPKRTATRAADLPSAEPPKPEPLPQAPPSRDPEQLAVQKPDSKKGKKQPPPGEEEVEEAPPAAKKKPDKPIDEWDPNAP